MLHASLMKMFEDIAADDVLSAATSSIDVYQLYALIPLLGSFGSARLIITHCSSDDVVRLNDSISIDLQIKQRLIAARVAELVKKSFEIRELLCITKRVTPLCLIAGDKKAALLGVDLFENEPGSVDFSAYLTEDNSLSMHTAFDVLWNYPDTKIKEVKKDVINRLSFLSSNITPDFLYKNILSHVLAEDMTDASFDPPMGFYDTQIWTSLYSYQRDGVKGCINKILRFNGCILADSVGLGKTYETLAVIKYFELLNYRVLVLCPKRLGNNWTIYQAGHSHALNPLKKDRFSYTVLYHTDVGRDSGTSKANGIDLSTFEWGNFDLVVIDESHNFRGDQSERAAASGALKMNRSKRLMENIIKSGVQTKVLLLSATPVNTSLRDLGNQISYITAGVDTALLDSGIMSVGLTLKRAQQQFDSWTEKKNTTSPTHLLSTLDATFFKLLDLFTIARSRKHLATHYNKESAVSFPKRKPPISVFPILDTSGELPPYDVINERVSGLTLSLFSPSLYVNPERLSKYCLSDDPRIAQYDAAQRESHLIGMLKMSYFKRLESSIQSFRLSLTALLKKITATIDLLHKFHTAQNDAIYILDDMYPDQSDYDDDDWVFGNKTSYHLSDIDTERWLRDLQFDHAELTALLGYANAVTPENDGKLAELKKQILEKSTKDNKKMLVFTAFSDTAEYLYSELYEYCLAIGLHAALITGTTTSTTVGKNNYESILLNFSPVSKNRASFGLDCDAEVSILIATDCISEGQNLQDCDCLVNYDIHWNPVRITQRFGRIDRLGSKNKEIELINFWPTKDLDAYINLKNRVEARMLLSDISATSSENVLLPEILTEHSSIGVYRDIQLKKLQNEVLDIEDYEGVVSLTDFTLSDFRADIACDFTKKTPGLMSVVPSPHHDHAFYQNKFFSTNENNIIQPGVVFCFKHKNAPQKNELNPLHPYYLTYIYSDGSVKYNFIHARQILEVLRLLCCEQEQTQAALYADVEKNLSHYTKLMHTAIDSIKSVSQTKEAARITSRRDAVLPLSHNSVSHVDDFLLISWLVVL